VRRNDKANTNCDLTEESAESEPAWQGAGESVGLQIWRIVVGIFARRDEHQLMCSFTVYDLTITNRFNSVS